MSTNKVYAEKVSAQIGEVYSVSPEFANTSVASGGQMRGTVVYIPAHCRYAVLEFQGVNGISREAFWPEDLQARCKGR